MSLSEDRSSVSSGGSDSTSSADEGEAAADWSDADEACVDLFSDEVLENPLACLRRAQERYGLDLTRPGMAADEYEWIKVVNYCRKRFRIDKASVGDIVREISDTKNREFLLDDALLRPVLGEDAMLYAYEELGLLPLAGYGKEGEAEAELQVHQPLSPEERIKVLEAELENAKATVRELVMEDTQGKDGGKKRTRKPYSDQYYFDSYAQMGIHEEMLRDRPRTEAYRDALDALIPRIPSAKVMDIGCGTGILSMFAARAGAEKVIGVEFSKIADLAETIIKHNRLDTVVSVEKARVEDLRLPDDCKVDVIVSEWMGYGLLFESMLDSVLVARDRYLKPGGRMVPSGASIFVQGQTVTEGRLFWSNVYGFDYSPVISGVVAKEPLVEAVSPETIITDRRAIFNIDIGTVTKEELDFDAGTVLVVQKDSSLTGIVVSFDCEMFKGGNVLRTGVEDTLTHWVQTVLPLRADLIVSRGQEIQVGLKYKRNRANPREIDITLTIRANASSEELLHVYTLG